MRRLIAGVVLCAFVVGCAGGPQLNTQALLDSVELSGDLRCEGEGRLSLLGFLTIKAEGLGVAGASTAGDAPEDNEHACAGVAISMGSIRWAWTSATQESRACKRYAGEMTVEVLE